MIEQVVYVEIFVKIYEHIYQKGGGINPVILKYFIYIYFRLKSFKKGRSGRPNKREGGGRISVYL